MQHLKLEIKTHMYVCTGKCETNTKKRTVSSLKSLEGDKKLLFMVEMLGRENKLTSVFVLKNSTNLNMFYRKNDCTQVKVNMVLFFYFLLRGLRDQA